MSANSFVIEAPVDTVNNVAIVRLSEADSSRLPSRGQVMTDMTVNGKTSKVVMEPDGRLGHWFRVPQHITDTSVSAQIAVTKEWPNPTVPADLDSALQAAPDEVQQLWQSITPMARWEWVRWVNATNNTETRQRRVEVSISKLQNGKRRPCCFNLSACTDPELARNAQLIV